jgi:hypothetical protein
VTVGDQRDLAEVAAGAKRAHLPSPHLDAGAACLDDEEADPRCALGHDDLAGVEDTLTERIGHRLELATVKASEERNPFEQTRRRARHRASIPLRR